MHTRHKPTPILFQHIPKTAGVSLRSIISCNFHVNEIAFVPDKLWMDKSVARGLVREYSFIHGHVHYEFFSDLLDSVHVITFLRHPVKRVISLYWYLRGQEIESISDSLSSRIVAYAKSQTVLQFVQNTDPAVRDLISNFQLRMLLSAKQQNYPETEWVNAAISNFRAYSFVGITELLDASVRHMSRRFGWICRVKPPVVNHSRASEESIEDSIYDAVCHLNTNELELYDRTRAHLEKALSLPDVPSEKEGVVAANTRQAYKTGSHSPVSMKEPLRCWGWHDRERNSASEFWRCAEAEVAGLEIKVKTKADFFLRLEIASVSAGISLRDMVILVNDRPVPTYVAEVGLGRCIFLQIDRQSVLRDGFITLEFHCSRVSKVDADTRQLPVDNRRTTFALANIDVILNRKHRYKTRSAARQQYTFCDDVGLDKRRPKHYARFRSSNARSFANFAHVSDTDPVEQSGALQRLDGPAFICAAYRKILHRVPDAQGFGHFQALLESGASKESVLSKLLYSREGLAKNPLLAMSKKAIIKHRHLKIPLSRSVIQDILGETHSEHRHLSPRSQLDQGPGVAVTGTRARADKSGLGTKLSDVATS